MTERERILAVVPARSGSKGIPNKNMQLLDDRSLIAHAGLTLQACPSVGRAIISTDSPLFAAEGVRYGLEAPFLRPKELSSDTASAVDTMRHALLAAEEHFGEQYSHALIIEPTCPLRTSADIEGAIALMRQSGDADSVISVSLVDGKYHPHKILEIREGHLDFCDPRGRSIVSRQALEPLYYRNGAVYVLTRRCLVDLKAIFTGKTLPYVIDRPFMNIDAPIELELARMMHAAQSKMR
jgi:CMP-N,N'-diacetyllegionaminic acid synthase